MTQVREQNGKISRRIREIREELYGEDGIPALAEILEIPEATWSNY